MGTTTEVPVLTSWTYFDWDSDITKYDIYLLQKRHSSNFWVCSQYITSAADRHAVWVTHAHSRARHRQGRVGLEKKYEKKKLSIFVIVSWSLSAALFL